MSAGAHEESEPLLHPAVATISTLVDGLALVDEVEQHRAWVACLRLGDALGPFGSTRADTALSESVISVTLAVKCVTSVTRPTSPSPLTTGSLTSTLSPEPWSIVTVEYQTVGERADRRAR